MGYHCRLEQPQQYFLISNRTHQGEFLFRPDQECRRIIKGCLAREAERKNVRLVAYVFPSNHFHLVAGFPDCNRSAFMRDFQGELADRINDHRGRTGTVFPKPYHPQAILDSETLLDKISYTVNNAVRHGLVTHPKAWPGVTSIEQHRTGKPLIGRWLDHNKWYNLRRRQNPPPRHEAMVDYELDLHVPDSVPGETRSECRETMLEAIEQGRRTFCQDAGLDHHRRADDPACYVKVDWQTTQPIDEDWCDIRRACAGKEAGKIANYLEWRREIDEIYEDAASAWKDGDEAIFPVGTYPPGRAQPVEQLEARAPPISADAA